VSIGGEEPWLRRGEKEEVLEVRKGNRKSMGRFHSKKVGDAVEEQRRGPCLSEIVLMQGGTNSSQTLAGLDWADWGTRLKRGKKGGGNWYIGRSITRLNRSRGKNKSRGGGKTGVPIQELRREVRTGG